MATRSAPYERTLIAVLAVVLSVELLACSSRNPVTSEAAQSPLSASLQLDPTPAHVGSERLTVTVRDRTGAPVTGAGVHISASFAVVTGGHAMPMPGMGRVEKTVYAAADGDGTYRAEVRVTKAAHWIFVVEVTAARTQTMIVRGVEVR